MFPYEMSTTPPGPEIAATTVEHNPNTSKPLLEESDITMTHVLTTTTEEKSASASTALLDSGMKTTVSATLPNITQAIAGMTDVFEVPTTSMVMDNNIQAMEPASTTVMTPLTATTILTTVAPAVTTSITVPTLNDQFIELFKESDQRVPVLATTHAPAVTTSIVMTVLGDFNELFKHPAETGTVAVTEETKTNIPSETDSKIEPSTSKLSPVLTEATILPSLDAVPFELNENSIISSLAQFDNVLTNEDTTRMASSTVSKVDSTDKHMVATGSQTEPPKSQTESPKSQTEPPKSQETKNELEPNGKSGCNSISTSFVVLSMAVLYVIV